MVKVNGNQVEFYFFRPQATRVAVVGDFNGWAEGALEMTCSTDGLWHASAKLSEGEHRFGYKSDGQFFADYAAFGLELGPYGLDSIVRVKPVLAAVQENAAMKTVTSAVSWAPKHAGRGKKAASSDQLVQRAARSA